MGTRIATGVRVKKLSVSSKVVVGRNGHGRPPKNLPKKGKVTLKLKASAKRGNKKAAKAKKPVLKSSSKAVAKTFAQCAKEAKIPKTPKECANWKNGKVPEHACI